MNQRFASMIAVAGIALALGSQISIEPTIGQEKAAEKEKAAPAKVAKKPRGRLPAYYGQVGISSKQRQEIYDVQAMYVKQIADLQKQIDALEKKRDGEVAAVLTPEQKKKVDDLVAAAKKRSEERRSKNKKKPS